MNAGEQAVLLENCTFCWPGQKEETLRIPMQQQGFQLQGDTVELTGICPRCAEMDAQAGA